MVSVGEMISVAVGVVGVNAMVVGIPALAALVCASVGMPVGVLPGGIVAVAVCVALGVGAFKNKPEKT